MSISIQPRYRITSIDVARGVAMVIMALDHVRDYFHADSFIYDPTDLTKTSMVLFGTRWITHFCAPAFMLLTGTSAFLVGERKGIPALAKFLFTRGLFLVFLEFTVINFAWNFNIRFPEIDFLVLWSLGVSMIALSGMVFLPKKVIMAMGVLLVAGHNLLDNVHVTGTGGGAFLWSLLHDPGLFSFGGKQFFVLYPILPWIGIIALGYSLGGLYAVNADVQTRRKTLLKMGTGAILLFIIIRAINLYGDPVPWTKQPLAAFSFLSFFNVTKYPPSLSYALITLGPTLLFLAFSESATGRLPKIFMVFGRTAMFYYILHIFLIHILATLATPLCGHTYSDMIWEGFYNVKLTGYGFSLGIVYSVWLLVILILYPLCARYDEYKKQHKEKWWLSYL